MKCGIKSCVNSAQTAGHILSFEKPTASSPSFNSNDNIAQNILKAWNSETEEIKQSYLSRQKRSNIQQTVLCKNLSILSPEIIDKGKQYAVIYSSHTTKYIPVCTDCYLPLLLLNLTQQQTYLFNILCLLPSEYVDLETLNKSLKIS